MTDTVREEAFITLEFFRENETSALHLLDSCRDECLTEDLLNNIYPDFSSALQDAEHRDLTVSSTTPVSLSSPAKIRLIHLNLPGKSD